MDRRTYLSRSGIMIAGVFFPASIIAFLDSCSQRNKPMSQLQLLSGEQASLLSSLTDMFIPPTDTPGASDVGVEARIDAVLYHNYEAEDQNYFKQGLDMIRMYCTEKYSKSFEELQFTEKNAVMQYLIQDAIKYKSDFRKHIYPMLKGLTIIAYFTSESVARSLLVFDPIPGDFKGDISYAEVGGIWSISIVDS